MKRTLSIALILALVLVLVFPTTAYAKKGGVPANGNDKGAPSVAGEDDSTDDEGTEESKPEKGKDKKKDAVEDDPAGESEKLTGRENALSRLQRNLERMQAQLEAGKRTELPEGLQSVIAKFMSWLGIESDDDAEDTDVGEDESDEIEDEEPADEPEDEPVDSPETPEVPEVE
ncbi:MAG: hypothetical protein EG823_01835 [Actinobacteria bacterium]|nr:hypothetical protein [Actinomycetota bacterium]